ncbi:hypothetical protein BO71DRAFT_405434 [Aspergillus ellipticus CBS 707.79]|uniref:Uncharacterized protein n=1 Tax=Aspergillus ellipticus CBS 707.79 TaxID=1448320 RepID=A0A319DYQ4_9EURO|nr:hypothetical protein BO71DRAFT_405434 [Aspergillus ellipticus CBS 707.79]
MLTEPEQSKGPTEYTKGEGVGIAQQPREARLLRNQTEKGARAAPIRVRAAPAAPAGQQHQQQLGTGQKGRGEDERHGIMDRCVRQLTWWEVGYLQPRYLVVPSLEATHSLTKEAGKKKVSRPIRGGDDKGTTYGTGPDRLGGMGGMGTNWAVGQPARN